MQHVQLPTDGTPLDLPDARLRYFKDFFDPSEASHYFTRLFNEIPWQQDPITIFGKTYDQLTRETVTAFLVDSKKSKFKIS